MLTSEAGGGELLHWYTFETHVDVHCAVETLPPAELVVDELTPEELPPDEVEDVLEEELEGPSPFVVEVQAANAPRARTRASVDFIPSRLPC